MPREGDAWKHANLVRFVIGLVFYSKRRRRRRRKG
jgi:hypothetical protein